MLKKFLVFLLLLAIPALYAGENVNIKSLQIDTLMNTYYNNGLFDGVVLVAQKGQIIYNKAFGIADREWNVPMTTDTKFKIASISKPFTALIILQLVQEGKLNLDGAIADYFPDYHGKQKERITIRHLLTHTSGIIGSMKPEDEVIKERLYYNLRDLIKYAEEAGLYCEPGSEFHYSNFGYNILAYIAEQVTSKPFAVLLQERIFAPVGMADSKQHIDTQIEERLAKGYEYKLLNGYENATYFDNSHTVGCGGIISTVDDLYKWHLALFSDQLLANELKNKMYEPTKQGQYGFGWGINNKVLANSGDTLKIAEHSGSVNGFGSYFAQILNDTTLVIVLKNSRDDSYISPAYAPNIGQEIISHLYGEQVIAPKKSIAKHIAFYIGRNGFDKAKEEYYRIKKTDSVRYSLEESELNKLGIELFFKFKMTNEALNVFALNMAEFPKSYNTYDSYAYILMQKQEYASAIHYYQEGLKILHQYPKGNEGQQVQKDAQKALEYIKEMEEKLARQN